MTRSDLQGWNLDSRPDRWVKVAMVALAIMLLAGSATRGPTDLARFNILDYAPLGTRVDQTGGADAAPALAAAIRAANVRTARGQPACVHIPGGVYRIASALPPFVRAGCVRGEGSSQTILRLDDRFSGDLFAWWEAWADTTPGPTIVGLKIEGATKPSSLQNAMVFYDRNDEVFIDDVTVYDLQGRALYFGAVKIGPEAYVRESHLRSIRLVRDGAPGVPVVEISSAGGPGADGTNEIKVSQMDIYAPRGPGLAIRNRGEGGVRYLTFDALRIEGAENGDVKADLLDIGDPDLSGVVSDIVFSGLELIDPYRGYAAMRLSAAPGAEPPRMITVLGSIGGGLPHGEGLRIDAGRNSTFRLSALHTEGTNIVIGPAVSELMIDGGGMESHWSASIDPSSRNGVRRPADQPFRSLP